MDKKKQKIEKISKPFLKGDVYDRTTMPSALKFFAGTVVLAVVFLIFCVMLNFDQTWLNIVANTAIVLGVYLFMHQFGMSAGADAVNQGEIMYSRQEKGRPVADWERSMCYHPFKGFLSALIGSAPLLLCSIVLACITQRQMTTLGTLPAWISNLETRPEIGGALAIYHETGSMDLESILRLIVRMSIMPFVNVIGAADKDAMLILERVCPLINLLPAVVYGLGYMSGVNARSAVHTNIALGKKKAKRKQAKERRARQNRGPAQLN